MTQLTHPQAYILTTIAKHADKYRRAIDNLSHSVESAQNHGPRYGFNIGAAMDAEYSHKVIEELLDQADEMFEDLDPASLSLLVQKAMTPTERGSRRRYIEGDEV